MIAKCTRSRDDGRSSFTALVTYIRDLKSQAPKAQALRISNCRSLDPDVAVMEIEDTQALNLRTQADKTYHLVISFPAGEHPTEAQRHDIEDRLCDAIGLGDHERISALHTDTEHHHLHVAINKIHPQTLKVHTPHRDYHKLYETCRRLEAEHGLTPLLGQDRTEPALSPGAAALEAHSGLESFESWVRGDPAQALKATLSQPGIGWPDVHRTLAAYDLELRPRGAGLVVADREGTFFTKASTMGRDITKGKLEGQLGGFLRPSQDIQALPATQRYARAPVQRSPKSQALWQQYQRERATQQQARRGLLADLKAEREQRSQDLKNHFNKRREALKQDRTLAAAAKKPRYSVLKAERLAAQEVLRDEMDQRRQTIMADHPTLSWPDFLIREAERGNGAALDALRSRSRRGLSHVSAHTLTPVEPPAAPPPLFRHFSYTIDRYGQVTYTLASGAKLQDDGQCLRVGDERRGSVEAALRLATSRYGSALQVNGSEAFKRQVTAVAVAAKMRVTFEDPDMEAERQRRLEAAKPARGAQRQMPAPHEPKRPRLER